METAIRVRIDLRPHRNNVGITSPDATGGGHFNVWRNSLPAAEVPLAREILVEGVPFDFPAAGAGQLDNVRCEGQLIAVPPARYDWLYLLASSERRAEDEIALHFTDGNLDFEPMRVSDFWVAPPAFGESAAVVTTAMHYPYHVQAGVPATIWCQRVAITRRADLSAIRLPSNVAIHVFAATLCGSPAEEEVA